MTDTKLPRVGDVVAWAHQGEMIERLIVGSFDNGRESAKYRDGFGELFTPQDFLEGRAVIVRRMKTDE